EVSDEQAEGGDVTFAIDERAERALEAFLAARAPKVAYYSEDRGLVVPDGAEEVLVVDPVDGTRPALAGLESCCVSVAAAPLADDARMGDVQIACVVEIPSGAVFLAERGRGLLESPRVHLSPNTSIESMFWTYGFRGRPARWCPTRAGSRSRTGHCSAPAPTTRCRSWQPAIRSFTSGSSP